MSAFVRHSLCTDCATAISDQGTGAWAHLDGTYRCQGGTVINGEGWATPADPAADEEAIEDSYDRGWAEGLNRGRQDALYELRRALKSAQSLTGAAEVLDHVADAIDTAEALP